MRSMRQLRRLLGIDLTFWEQPANSSSGRERPEIGGEKLKDAVCIEFKVIS